MPRFIQLARKKLGLAVCIGGGVALGNSLLPAAGRPALLASSIPDPVWRTLIYFGAAFAGALLLLVAAEWLKGVIARLFEEEGRGKAL
ncbi:MAG: hypothetical protein LBD02_07005 [Christensenellaceae bacterium]|jgi:hypothetical protein|nr:hypothetical protein [Christensenellaceae bacterium]